MISFQMLPSEASVLLSTSGGPDMIERTVPVGVIFKRRQHFERERSLRSIYRSELEERKKKSPWEVSPTQGLGVAHGVLGGSTAKGRGLGIV